MTTLLYITKCMCKVTNAHEARQFFLAPTGMHSCARVARMDHIACLAPHGRTLPPPHKHAQLHQNTMHRMKERATHPMEGWGDLHMDALSGAGAAAGLHHGLICQLSQAIDGLSTHVRISAPQQASRHPCKHVIQAGTGQACLGLSLWTNQALAACRWMQLVAQARLGPQAGTWLCSMQSVVQNEQIIFS